MVQQVMQMGGLPPIGGLPPVAPTSVGADVGVGSFCDASYSDISSALPPPFMAAAAYAPPLVLEPADLAACATALRGSQLLRL